MKKLKKTLLNIAVLVFWVAVWHIAASIANKSLLLSIPLPLETAAAFFAQLKNAEFYAAVLSSLMHILSGYVFAVILGAICGILSGSSQIFRSFSAPVLHIIRSVPVAAFIFVAWLWIPTQVLPAFIAGLMVMPIIWSHIDAAMAAADKKYLEMGRVFGLSRTETELKIRLPFIMPQLRAGCITGLGIAWKAGVAAEIICNPGGSIGALLQRGKVTVEYTEVFAVTLAVVLLSLLLECILKAVWKEKKQ